MIFLNFILQLMILKKAKQFINGLFFKIKTKML